MIDADAEGGDKSLTTFNLGVSGLLYFPVPLTKHLREAYSTSMGAFYVIFGKLGPDSITS